MQDTKVQMFKLGRSRPTPSECRSIENDLPRFFKLRFRQSFFKNNVHVYSRARNFPEKNIVPRQTRYSYAFLRYPEARAYKVFRDIGRRRNEKIELFKQVWERDY